jgi:hypothetical protein
MPEVRSLRTHLLMELRDSQTLNNSSSKCFRSWHQVR